VKSEQEKKKKGKSELANFEKLSATTTAKAPHHYHHHYHHHCRCHHYKRFCQLRSIIEKANEKGAREREKRGKERAGTPSIALPGNPTLYA
jgi:uncharacterized protein with von Willebrand factor type A (vWA) domain